MGLGDGIEMLEENSPAFQNAPIIGVDPIKDSAGAFGGAPGGGGWV